LHFYAATQEYPLAIEKTHKADCLLQNRQAVTQQKATASSDKASGYWEREQAAGEGNRLLGKEAGYWDREQATGKGSRLLRKGAGCWEREQATGTRSPPETREGSS